MDPMRPTNALKHAGADARCVLARCTSSQAHASGDDDDSPARMDCRFAIVGVVCMCLHEPILLNCGST